MINRTQRIPFRDLAELTAEDADTAANNRIGGRDLNLFRVLMHHPKLTRRWTVFAGHVLHKQTLGLRDRELLILRIGWLNQAEYEWAQHVEIAKRGGISETEIPIVRNMIEGVIDDLLESFDLQLCQTFLVVPLRV